MDKQLALKKNQVSITVNLIINRIIELEDKDIITSDKENKRKAEEQKKEDEADQGE